MANTIPNIVLHTQFVGTMDSADFQGPIAGPVSEDFRHFFTQIATEYDDDPIPTWQTTHDSAVLPIRPIFRVRSPDTFLTIFGIFPLKSPPNTMVTPSQQWQTTHDSAVLPIRPIFRIRSPDPFVKISPYFHSNRHRMRW